MNMSCIGGEMGLPTTLLHALALAIAVQSCLCETSRPEQN
jgi:hypothetical protein